MKESQVVEEMVHLRYCRHSARLMPKQALLISPGFMDTGMLYNLLAAEVGEYLLQEVDGFLLRRCVGIYFKGYQYSISYESQ